LLIYLAKALKSLKTGLEAKKKGTKAVIPDVKVKRAALKNIKTRGN
jgi:hypothetical protein